MAFMVAMPFSMAFATDAWRVSGAVQTSCRYWHPGHRPRSPKFMHAPSRPIRRSKNLTRPCWHRSVIVKLGYSRLNVPTAFWHSGGIAVLTVGCGQAAATGLGVRVPGGNLPPGARTCVPKNAVSGHESVVWMTILDQMANCEIQQ